MDDEIIIGIDVKDNSNKKKNKKLKKNSQKKKSSKKGGKDYIKEKNNRKEKIIKNNQRNTSKASNTSKYVKRKNKTKNLGIIILFIIFIIFILGSSMFNIQKIEVTGNDRISDETVISLSGLELYKNIFTFNKLSVVEKIKENAYIKSVKISRKLPDTVKITVQEKIPRYIIQIADSYAYINNQGYILEISTEKENMPILLGLSTDLSNIKVGERINVEDLKKMDMVIKICEIAKSNDLKDLITKIDISDDKNYTIILEKEGKTVYLGDCSDLNTRMLYLKSVLEASSGKSGEIFLNVDLNSDNVYFRPSSN